MVHKPRVYQILRRSGMITTRGQAQKLIEEGKITINGKIIHSLEFQFNPAKETLLLDLQPLAAAKNFRYIMLHKPIGYITATKPLDGRKPVMDLLDLPPPLKNTLSPIGRLDVETSGLLIITNDGKFARTLLDPHKKVEKEYRVETEGSLNNAHLQHIQRGIPIEVDGKPYRTLPAKAILEHQTASKTILRLIISEGKKRQIRLMMKALGHPVLNLKRIRVGKLFLGNLPVGKWKEITKKDVLD